MVFKRTILFLALGLSFCQPESKYPLHPKFRGMIMENSFDEASGEVNSSRQISFQPLYFSRLT